MRSGIHAEDGIKISNYLVLRWEEYPGLSQWAQCNKDKSPYKQKKQEGELVSE